MTERMTFATLPGKLLLRALPALAALACLAAAPAARAQIVIRYNGVAVTTPILFGKTECLRPAQLTFTWDLGTGYPGTAVTVVATTTAPSSGTTCPTGKAESSTTGTTNTASVTVTDFINPVSPADGGTSAGCNTVSTSANPGVAYFCISYPVPGTLGTTSGVVSAWATVQYALQPPGPPTSLQAEPGDSHVKLSWSPASSSDSINKYDVYAVLAGATVDLAHTTQSPSTPAADVHNTDDGQPLSNGTAYDFYVRALDTYGNDSDLSAKVTASPQTIDDFYNHYRNDGGTALGGGGCSTGGGAGLFALFALLLLFVRRLRRGRSARGAAAAALLVALGAASRPARATDELPSPSVPESEKNPRHLLIALKLDRYSPQIDSAPSLNGTTPYHDIFHGRAPLRWQLEVDWEAAHPFGSLLFGGTVGFWQNIGKGLIHSTGAQSGDTALLDVVPFSAVATYRFDWVADRVRFLPVIPYAQAGLTAALWTSFAGNGNVSTRNVAGESGRGSGWSYGYTTALGFALALDVLTPGIANEARRDLGLKRSAVFAEYGWTRLDNFGKQNGLVLSDRAWRFGVSLEF